MIDFTKELNAQQLKVVQNGDGPCLVLAGAGSGKTRTVCYRVAYLLEKGIKPENILLVTFTNQAASEMKERVGRLALSSRAKSRDLANQLYEIPPLAATLGRNDSAALPWSGTFHHIAYRILKVYAPLLGYTNNFTVLDSDDSESILKLCIKDVKSDQPGQRFPSASVVSSIISYSRNAQLSLAQVIEDRYYQWIQYVNELGAIANAYTQKKKEAQAMDFDDLLTNFLLLLQDEKICHKYASLFQYVLVDEYQDTNKIQASLIRQLSSIHNNLLVVGDDAQSIYSFRAADIHNILGFELIYPGAQVFKLEINYRSSQEILSVANNVIANNHEQYKKDLRVVDVGTGRDLSLPRLYPQIDQQSEASFIAKKIAEHIAQGISPKEIAVLFRAAHHSQMLEVELVQRGIAYDYRGGVRFFERAHIKDILSYLRIMNNLADTAAWLRVLMHEEGIGPAAAQRVIEEVKQVSQVDQVSQIGERVLGPKAQTGWNHFINIWQTLIETPARVPGKLIEALVNSPYRDYLESEYLDSRDRLADIKQLAVFAERYTDLDQFLGEMTLQESFRTINSDPSPSGRGTEGEGSRREKIVLSTIHQAKGLEWTAVFIINLSAGAFPSERAMKEDNGLEEERRLLYVAITRAKKNLYLTYPMAGGSFGDFLSGPSLFLNEINPELLEDHSLLVSSSSVFNDSSAGVEYIDEDAPVLKKKPMPGSFLADINDL